MRGVEPQYLGGGGAGGGRVGGLYHSHNNNNNNSSSSSNGRTSSNSIAVVSLLLVVFCLGIMIGSQWTIMTNSQYNNYQTRNLDIEIPSSTTATTTSRNNHDDGWQTVNVYYGSSDIKEQDLSLSSQDQQKQQQSIFVHSQARQDECVLSLLRNQTNGYFIDLASNDATILSNTYSLERYFDWNGLCIEPNPIYWVRGGVGCGVVFSFHSPCPFRKKLLTTPSYISLLPSPLPPFFSTT